MKVTKHITSIIILIFVVSAAFAQRKVSGIVYKDGEPAAGIVVEAHKSNDSYYTSFDGKYELTISDKTKYLRFAYGDNSKKLDITTISEDEINFSWDGTEIPSQEEAGIDKRSFEKLQKDRDSEFLSNFSLYREFFKQNDFKSAYSHWKFLYKKYPYSTAQIYIDGVKMYETKLEKAFDSRVKMAYLDSIMQVYDKRIKYLDNKGDLLGRKAAKYLEVVLTCDVEEDELIEGIKTGYGFAEESIKELKNETQPAVLVLYLQSAKKLYTMDELSKAAVLENYEKTMSILEGQLKDPDMADKANQAIPLITSIIEGAGVLDCGSIEEIYAPKIKANPNDITLVKKVLKMLNMENCTDGELYKRLSEKLYKLEPSPEAAFNMARMFLKSKQNEKAFEYYAKAYNTIEDPSLKAEYYYEAGMLSLQLLKYKEARDFGKLAVKFRPEYCKAYMLIGEAYAQASKDFEGDEFAKSSVFWVATDYFKKAINGDCVQDAQNKVSFYSNYFPNKEEIFYRTLSENSKFKVEGWINEMTTIRAKK